MGDEETRTFRDWFKIVVDHACEAEDLTRQELADVLGVHIHSVSTAGYRGQIGWDLLDQLAHMAKMTAEEMVALELAWLEMRSQKTHGDSLRRSVSIIQALMSQVVAMEEWIEAQGLMKKYKKTRPADGLLRRTRQRRRKKR